jgi:pimeloyl-ACP methyl ester carboxylesterase
MRNLMLAFALIAAAGAAKAAPPPCTTPTPACQTWIDLGGGARAPLYSTYPLSTPNPAIRRALIMIHGALRNPDRYFRTATGAAFLAGGLGDTIVIAPGFHATDGECHDTLAPNEVAWGCESWRSGGVSTNRPDLTSFQLLDEILRRLADKKVFPNLTAIVVAGHSAGGQVVARYQMVNRVHETLGAPVTYVVANPSSYAWPDATRALPVDDAAPAEAALDWKSEAPHTQFTYGTPDTAKAPDYNRWPYGLEGRTAGYASGETDDQLKAQLVSRPTTYLYGQVDVLPLGGFDDTPNAMAQGPTRRARGEAFVNFVNTRLGGHAKVMIVPECGHNDRCMFTTDAVLAVLFPGAANYQSPPEARR